MHHHILVSLVTDVSLSSYTELFYHCLHPSADSVLEAFLLYFPQHPIISKSPSSTGLQVARSSHGVRVAVVLVLAHGVQNFKMKTSCRLSCLSQSLEISLTNQFDNFGFFLSYVSLKQVFHPGCYFTFFLYIPFLFISVQIDLQYL